MGNEYIEKCIKAAITHGIAVKDGNSKKANIEYDKFEKYYYKILKSNKSILLGLLNHENNYVKLLVASYLIKDNENVAVTTLEKLSEEPELLGFTAQWTLSEWKKGNLK